MVLDLSRYSWKHDPIDNSYTREATGGELMEYYWRSQGLGDYVVILMAELTFSAELPQEILIQCMQNAWAAMRYEAPIVAAQSFYDEENLTRIVYNPARSTDEVKAWASRTVRVVDGFDDIEQFRHSISCQPIRDANGDQTFLYVLPHGPLPGACSLLVHASHITFDGKGLQVLFTAFMKKLVAAISLHPSEAYQKLEWGTEGKNLLPVPHEILGEAEICSGPEYDATLNSVLNDAAIFSSEHAHGLKFRVSDHYPLETKRANFTFTARDSQRFFKTVKSLGFTVNHVCHAALMLACVENNPVPEEKLESAAFASPHLRDGRQRLRPPYSDRGGYPGFCLTISSIIIPAKAFSDLPPKDNISRLIYVSDLMKKEYGRQNAYSSLIATAPERTEVVISPFKNNTTIPPPLSSGPWYSGDGRGEQYLDPVFLDDSGKTIAEIRSFVTSFNKSDPAPFFRVWSWRDCLTVSADYNPRAIPESVVEGLLNRWKELVACLMQ